MDRILGTTGIQMLEVRGLDVELAQSLGLYTVRWDGSEFIPDRNGKILAFPYLEFDVEVNTKYRAEPKRFSQRPGGRKTFWNSDVLDDPALADGRLPLIITEGEYDAIAAIQSGNPTTVSVPEGAPPANSEERPSPKSASDETGKYQFLWNNRDRLKRVRRIVLAVDNDLPGKRLADELVRRLGAWRCCFVSYPSGCKDFNEVLQAKGPQAVTKIIADAQPYPVKGLHRMSDYPEQSFEVFSTGWETIDRNMQIFPGELIVMTGIPSHGKSTWAMNLLLNVAKLHGWRSAVFSPEMPPVPHMRDLLYRMADQDRELVEDKFVFISRDLGEDVDDDITLEWLIERATDAVLRDGIRVFLIDPWNEIEHARMRDETTVDYIGRALRQLRRFARSYGVAVMICAHPTKDVVDRRSGKTRVPNLYDVEGAAHWFNKADHALVIHRANSAADEADIYISKCKFREAGEPGLVRMRFDRYSSRYEMLAPLEPI